MANQKEVLIIMFENIEESQNGNVVNTYVNLQRSVYSGN